MTDDPTPAEDERLHRLLSTAAAIDVPGDGLRAAFAARRRSRVRRGVQAGATIGISGVLVAGVVALSLASSPTHPSTRAIGGPSAATPTFAHLTGVLTSFDACSDYLAYVKQAAAARVGPYGVSSTGIAQGGYGAATSIGGAFGVAAAGGATVSGGGAASASAAPAGGGGGTQSEEVFSRTNDQVGGVDEPDTVKTDGHVVVTLAGTTLRVLDPTAHVLGTLRLDGDTGGGLLLAGSSVVVLPTPPAAPLTATRFSAPAPASNGPAAIEVVDVRDPAHPNLVRTFHLDGGIVGARLVDGTVRLVDRADGPRLHLSTPSPTMDPQAATAANKAVIDASTTSDWLPTWQVETPDGATTARQPIAACTSVVRPATPAGTSTVTLLSLDPSSPSLAGGGAVVGAGDVVYATADHLYVAGESTPTTPGATPGQYDPSTSVSFSGCCTVIAPSGATTTLYEFATPAKGRSTFVGAGSVPGWLLNSYAIDDDGTQVRVVTTERTPAGSDTVLSVLRLTGTTLRTVGRLGGLGAGEAVRAVRFIGAQAYVVTFRSFDPLFVIDVRDPAHPTLSGELDQPGFSEFLYPLPGDRLLGIGVVVANGGPDALEAATYDVHDPAHPTRISAVPLLTAFAPGRGFDPHELTYWAPDRLVLVATPPGGAFFAGPTSTGSPGVAALTVGTDGVLHAVATLSHGTDSPTRPLVIDGSAWGLGDAGVVTAPLPTLTSTSWHPY